ncbi:response regulator receiver [Gemmatirosa kalamazoonensis]|uniref:Response regulator receiver n=1 Tax=Gemmatirosa kalamazoonensis TaxID=861299 RepID=W0RM29_9BACT|nr:HD domain-containing phosphohydrolase [Gemmatirosa kalamazoonensis]AHG90498.1 response regulator receiver [Gemmatirosa kalamazoonensis]
MTAPSEERPRVLVVDDEPSVTAAVARVLRRGFDVTPTHSADEGLALIRRGPSFAVVISDFQMPGMDGAAFLREVRRVAPDTARVLLTGRTDLAAAVAAVNQGQIFRYLAKPPSPDVLTTVVTAATEHHRLLRGERELLEQTLQGSLKALLSLMALAQPAALGRTSRIKSHVTAIAERLDVADRWSLEIAALLSQVGCVTLPDDTMQKLARGQALTPREQEQVDRLPGIAATLVAGIPRLEPVREILRFQNTHFDGAASPEPGVAGAAIPLGARVLKVVLDYDLLETQGMAADAALAALEARPGGYDPAVLAAGRQVWLPADPRPIVREMRLADVRPGMVFANDVVGSSGVLLVARGQEVTDALLERVRYDWRGWAHSQHVVMLERWT